MLADEYGGALKGEEDQAIENVLDITTWQGQIQREVVTSKGTETGARKDRGRKRKTHRLFPMQGEQPCDG